MSGQYDNPVRVRGDGQQCNDRNKLGPIFSRPSRVVACVGLMMSMYLLVQYYSGKENEKTTMLPPNDGFQSTAEFHDRPLAHFDTFPREEHSANESEATNAIPTVSVGTFTLPNRTDSADELLIQMALVVEITAVVILIMFFLDRLPKAPTRPL